MTPEEIKDEAETYAGLKIWIAPDNCNGQAFYEYISETSYFDGYTAAQSNIDTEILAFENWKQQNGWRPSRREDGTYYKAGQYITYREILALFRNEPKS